MKTIRRLAFLLPLLAAAPAGAAPVDQKHSARVDQHASATPEPMHYVTLDRMIRSFASRAHAERQIYRSVVLAQR